MSTSLNLSERIRVTCPVLGLLVLESLAPSISLAHQDAHTLRNGSLVVKLKRINTVAGGANANLLYGTFAPGDSKLFIVQQGSTAPSSLPGRVRYIDPTAIDGPVGTLIDFSSQLPGVLDSSHFEKGLLGLAFHPDFNKPGKPGYLKFYTYSSERRTAHTGIDFIHPETATDPENLVNHLAVLREWTADSTTPTSAVPSRVILRIAEPQNQHNGGTIAFSPVDGCLYWALGDGGGNSSSSPAFVGAIDSPTDGHSNSTGPGVPHGNVQDRTNPLSSMLRINPLRAAAAPDPNATPSVNGEYQIPINNPFTMASNIDPETSQPYPDWNANWVDEIFAYGLRNPYRFSFDPGTGALDPHRGNLYLGDAGYNSREEIDLILRGGNYGWVIREGTRSMEGEQGIPAYTAPVNAMTGLPDTLIDPVAEYDASSSSGNGVGRAVIGGFVYRGTKIPALKGKYIFGDNNARPNFSSERGMLFYLDTAEVKDPSAPFTIYRMQFSPAGDGKPVADLLGFAEGPDGEVYALFDNGRVVGFNSAVDLDEPPHIVMESVSGDEIRFAFQTHEGRNYRVEFKSSLTGTGWMELITVTGTGQLEQVSDGLTNGLERYYRVVVE